MRERLVDTRVSPEGVFGLFLFSFSFMSSQLVSYFVLYLYTAIGFLLTRGDESRALHST